MRGQTLLADAVASSVEEHARFGGVVPEVASRAHLEAMVPTIERACETAGVTLRDVDAIAVTAGPGLAGALLVGVAAAKSLALGLDKPLYGVNHLAAHVAVDQLEHGALPDLCLAMLVSGGHSSLLRVGDVTGGVDPLGSTIDDAAGEAFDKVARLLGLPFPGGPYIDKAAASGSSVAIDFPRGLTSRRDLERHRFDFSFSGLKTAVARWVQAQEAPGEPVPVADVAASFQEAVCDVLTRKAIDAARRRGHRGHPDRRRGRGELSPARARRGARRRAWHPGPRPASRALHRQRRHGRRPRLRDGLPRPHAFPPRPPGRLLDAGGPGARLGLGHRRVRREGVRMQQVKGVVARSKGAPVTIETINVPDPGPGEALVKVQTCGVCHTDLHYREGGINDDFPFLLGHEAAGVVEAVGPDVTEVAPGDFVVLNWRAVCGDCRACNRGEPWYCFSTFNATQKMTLEDGTELSPGARHRLLRREDPGRGRPVHQGRRRALGPRPSACSAAA